MYRVECVEAFLLDVGCSAGSAQQWALVAEELFANIMGNAWPGREPGHCSIEVTAVAKPDVIHVSLRAEDDGIAFDPLQAEPPDLEATLEDRPIGGLGIMFIKTMTDHQSYQRIDGHNIFAVAKDCQRA